jgi:hypothetical protein
MKLILVCPVVLVISPQLLSRELEAVVVADHLGRSQRVAERKGRKRQLAREQMKIEE